jgi:ERCC4-type nuclease
MQQMHIIIDSREQTPWSWDPHLVRTSIAGLDAGDYALATDCTAVSGRETMICAFSIERKSLDDFIGTIGSGWERFKNELHRMRGFPARVVIVEANFLDCCFVGKCDPPKHNHNQITPAFVVSRLSRLAMMGVTVWFGGDASGAALLAYGIFKDRLRGM